MNAADERQGLTALGERLLTEFTAQRQSGKVLSMRAAYVDELLQRLYAACGLEACAGVCLVAVGGYGRLELFPGSDIDICVFSETDPLPPEYAEKISAFISGLWDLRLKLGTAVRTLRDTVIAARDDITIFTALLESRRIAGSERAAKTLRQALRQNLWTPQNYIRALCETRNAALGPDSSIYALEPDLKNHPGGLRDLHMSRWCAKMLTGAKSFADLVPAGVLNQSELEDLRAAQSFIFDLRCALHLTGGGDTLHFDLQPKAAALMGFAGTGNDPVTKMMRKLYESRRQILELRQIMLQAFSAKATENSDEADFLGAGFVRHGNYADIIDPQMFTDNPARIVGLFALMSRTPGLTDLHYRTIRALRQARAALKGQYLLENRSCRAEFARLLAEPAFRGRPLQLMHLSGMLSLYLPQWQRIEGLMQYDMFHKFTVNEHSIRTVTNLSALAAGSDQRLALYREVYAGISDQQVLGIAALLHDIAKGRGGGHADLGAHDTLDFCILHGLSRYQAETAAWLVRNHLLFPTTALRRDIADPEVVSRLADACGSVERLMLMYCLSVADICATNLSEWNQWKESLFRQLYEATLRILHGDKSGQDLKRRGEEVRQQAAARLTTIRKSDLLQHFSRFPEHYFVRYSIEEICWHARNIVRCQSTEEPLILFAQMPGQAGTRLLGFIHHAEPLLFGNIAYAMAEKHLNIMSAQIDLAHDGSALITAVFQTRQGVNLDNGRLDNLRRAIQARLKNPEADPQGLPAPAAPAGGVILAVPDEVRLVADDGACSGFEVSALDTPGLLARLALAIGSCGCLLTTARITTTGARADDFFKVADPAGLPLDAEGADKVLNALRAALRR